MIKVEISDAEVQSALNRIAAGLTDMTPVMQDIGELVTTSTKDRFGRGLAPDGCSPRTWG